MGVGSGIGASVGIGPESSYGSGGSATKWIEFTKETIVRTPKRVQPKVSYAQLREMVNGGRAIQPELRHKSKTAAKLIAQAFK